MVDSKYSLKLKNNHKPENKCIDAKKCQFLFVMQYWRMNCGTLCGKDGGEDGVNNYGVKQGGEDIGEME